MNFDLSEEQVMLKDSVARFVQDNYDIEKRRAIVDGDTGFSAENWQTFAELGWLSVPFEEEVGGFGGSAADVMAVMEELGKGLVVEPYLATVLLFGGLVQALGSSEQKEALLTQVIGGEIQGAFAYLERHSRFDLNDVSTSAAVAGDGYALNGEKTVVFNGMAADKLVVSARTSGEQSDEAGISLFVIDANGAGVSRSGFKLMDGQTVANITLDNAAGELLGGEGAAFAVMQQVVDTATLALCAEAMGIMQYLQDATVEYSRTREQFGVAIGSFQALQHRMVETFMSCEQTRSMLVRAVCSSLEQSDEEQKDLHALKMVLSRHGKLVGDEAIQIHGGMGMTDELDIGHYVKRLMMINTIFGNGDYHQDKFNQLAYG
jgi:alkylation response protein AidB-like acyl-CoA dehydrogenase